MMVNFRKHVLGFTLIEVIVVIAIIGVLSSIVVLSISGYLQKARDTRRIADIRQIATALNLYYTTYGNFPCLNQSISTSDDFLEDVINEGLLSVAPQDPVNSEPYIYGYYSWRNDPAGQCGQIMELNIDMEHPDTRCPLGGVDVGGQHCHILIPTPLPCSDPYGGGGDCANLKDS